MKFRLPIISLNVFFFAAVSSASISNIARSNPLFEIFEAKYLEISEDPIKVTIQDNELRKAKLAFAPQMFAQGGTKISKFYNWADGKKINAGKNGTQKWEQDSDVQVGLSQNIFKSFQDTLSVELETSKKQKEITNLKIGTINYFIQGIFELQQIFSVDRFIQIREDQTKQSLLLLSSANRKFKSGLLGPRDLLRVEQEHQKTIAERDSQILNLKNKQDSFLLRYQMNTNEFKEKIWTYFLDFKKLTKRSDIKLSKENLNQNLNLVNLNEEKSLAKIQARIVNTKSYFTTLDLNLGAQYNFKDKINSFGQGYQTIPNRTLVPFASLDFKISLFDLPSAYSSNSADLLVSQISKQSVRAEKDLKSAFYDLNAEIDSRTKITQNSEKLLKKEQDIFEKTTRLFQAGEVSIEVLIDSQTSLHTLEITNATQMADLEMLEFKRYLAREYGIITK